MYYTIIKETVSKASELWEIMTDFRPENLLRTVGLWIVVLVIFILSFGMLKSVANEYAPKYGTISLYITLSLVTLGLGALFYLVFDKITNRQRVYERAHAAIGYLIGPSLTSILVLLIMTYVYGADSEISVILASASGIVAFVAMVIEILVAKTNRSVYIELSDSMGIAEVKPIALNYATRRCLTKNGTYVCRALNQNEYKAIRTRELARFLMIDEEEGLVTKRTYEKPDGSRVNVAVLEDLRIPKLCDSLAGVLMWLLVTTPYIPYVLTTILDHLV